MVSNEHSKLPKGNRVCRAVWNDAGLGRLGVSKLFEGDGCRILGGRFGGRVGVSFNLKTKTKVAK